VAFLFKSFVDGLEGRSLAHFQWRCDLMGAPTSCKASAGLPKGLKLHEMLSIAKYRSEAVFKPGGAEPRRGSFFKKALSHITIALFLFGVIANGRLAKGWRFVGD
jgi:hypothetical protein